MEHQLRELGQKILAHKYELARKIDEVRKEYGETVTKPSEQILQIRGDLFRYFGEALYQKIEEVEPHFIAWGKRSGELAVQYEVPLDAALKSTRFFRVVLWDFIRNEIHNESFSVETVLKAASIIDPLLDETVHAFSVAYVENNNRVLGLAREAIEELSVPVVRLTRTVAVLPLVGTIDTHRSKLIMETSLQKCTELQVEHLFIDLSGVPVIDTMVAHNLFKVINSLQLLGVQVTLSGMRPELAQTVVSLGISFKGISIAGNLYQELETMGIAQQTI
ncbi:STAS domain-containing protein [Fictibacillus phosphorivorans]|uniref:STAS domain-containing protein n=1 Tax=Fictibacillus phosphorivorans TaxID=1221500 RepID=UPI00203C731D|nr:STAS domain-containing protein [Fictibacillus phosphorivorans]MCM3718656.1 STAS domain-containing protein [Fictibacillus phosphorivorans]MCM3776279.1 STAS domain-containing protein [Fictibacillus phosphorivorans]